ncbi:microtubule-associated protein futsch [Anopheles moucheti]|uniref:microtubule-associated protein futsch n=1 Tax=Anopheles moucheti TaxID=186751 RepID=UPI0022F0300E|nr:microtubule-associated protein futsch [Anopheles moucheti]
MENPDDEKQQLPSPASGDLPEGLVLVSSDSDDPDEDEDHEEGEIQDKDDEDEQQPQELEDISSEEESTIRERMAALEAMDKKVGMMKRKFANHSKYDYLDVEEVMNGKENYCYYYPQHQNPLYRSYKPYKPTTTNKEDNRYSVAKYTRTVATKRPADKVKEKSSKRSSHRRHKRRRYASRSPTPSERRALSTDSEPEALVDREYLKIACGVGNGKNQRLSSSKNPLKKKLLLQTTKWKRKAEVKRKKAIAEVLQSPSSNSDDDAVVVDDDEEDEEAEEELQLRLLALSTKPIVREAGLSEIISEFQIPSPPPPPTINQAEHNLSDAVSAEEHELRIIALKTAVLKKHESRKKRRELDNEQPYSPSDDIVLSPVREIAPPYDNELYSEGRDSVEMIEDDQDDVLIVEPHYEQIDLVDSDDNGNDMEISPLGSPIGRVDETVQDMEEHAQQPIDMELASSDSISSAPSPVYSATGTEHRLLLGGTDSCDSALFHRRGEMLQESPSATPDSMEEAEAEALRHLLLTKMRQKQTKKKEEAKPAQVILPLNDEHISCQEHEEFDTAPKDNVPVVSFQDDKQLSACEDEPDREPASLSPKISKTSNLITIVDRTTQRKRRKKSLTNSATGPVVEAVTAHSSSTPTNVPSDPCPQLTKASSIVHTQKLVNNPNKLINLNRTAAPSPPTILTGPRTESPKDPTMVETFVSRPVAKLVIQLGHSDSDSEVDFSTSSPEKGDNANAGSVAISVEVTTGGAPATPTVRFEEQLDKFLKSVRSKSTTVTTKEDPQVLVQHSERGVSSSEKSLASTKQQQPRNAAKKLPTSSNAMATPTAVRHLSKSAQMEYMRLVARKAQLERYKLARQSSAHTSSSSVGKESSVPKQDTRTLNSSPVGEQKTYEPKLGKSPGRRKQSCSSAAQPTSVTESTNEEQATVQDPIERKLQQIRTSLPNLSEASRNRLLLTAEKQLEKHSGTFLNELERHNATLLEAQEARRELYHLENRIDLLKEKLSLLENVYEKRRHRSYDTFSSLQATRKKILFSRKRSGELERMCGQIGRIIKGESYQLPTSSKGAVVQQQLRILVAETQQLKNIRKPTLHEFKEDMIANHKRRLGSSSDQTPSWKMNTYGNECDEGRPIEAVNSQKDDSSAEPEEINPSEPVGPVEETSDPVSHPAPPELVDESCTKEPSEQVEEAEMPTTDIANDVECSEAAEPLIVQNVTQADVTVETVAEQEKEMPNIEVLPQEDEPVPCIEPGSKEGEEDTMMKDKGNVPGETFRMEKYTSPLMSLKQGAQNIPTGILCPFELGGQCVDQDCKYEHFNQRTA